MQETNHDYLLKRLNKLERSFLWERRLFMLAGIILFSFTIFNALKHGTTWLDAGMLVIAGIQWTVATVAGYNIKRIRYARDLLLEAKDKNIPIYVTSK